MPLTETDIKAARADPARHRWLNDGAGLYLREPWASVRPIDDQTGEPRGAWTPHDLRRSFGTRLGGLGVAPHVIEKLLNHTAEGMSRIYNRAELLEERIAATKLWAVELARIVSGTTAPGP